MQRHRTDDAIEQQYLDNQGLAASTHNIQTMMSDMRTGGIRPHGEANADEQESNVKHYETTSLHETCPKLALSASRRPTPEKLPVCTAADGALGPPRGHTSPDAPPRQARDESNSSGVAHGGTTARRGPTTFAAQPAKRGTPCGRAETDALEDVVHERAKHEQRDDHRSEEEEDEGASHAGNLIPAPGRAEAGGAKVAQRVLCA